MSWRSGDGEYPDTPVTSWGADAEYWPTVRRWVPDRDSTAIIVCLRTHSGPSEILDWGDPQTAAEADVTLYRNGCGRHCERNHVVAWTSVGELHIRRGSHDRPPRPADRREELRQCYPRRTTARSITTPNSGVHQRI